MRGADSQKWGPLREREVARHLTPPLRRLQELGTSRAPILRSGYFSM